MRERRRRHDDAHYPMQGRGKRAPRAVSGDAGPRIVVDNGVQCPGCGANQTDDERGACSWCGTVYRATKEPR